MFRSDANRRDAARRQQVTKASSVELAGVVDTIHRGSRELVEKDLIWSLLS